MKKLTKRKLYCYLKQNEKKRVDKKQIKLINEN